MILVTVNKSKKTITLTSFMRDAHVTIPGYKSNKLNAAYAFGGMSLLNQTLEQNYGVRVDGDIEVDFNSFQKIIDMLGGVDIKLTKKEVTYLNNGMHLNGTDRELHVGTQRLDGEIALAYSRLRSIDSDYRRAERQRTVITALIERYKNQSTTQMLAMLEDILPLVVTNMSKGEIVDYTMDLTPLLAGAQLNTLRIPVDGTFRQGTAKVRPGLAAWFQYDIDFAANREVLNEVFAEDDTP
jgi:LCP family protein required for cell wall assembly